MFMKIGKRVNNALNKLTTPWTPIRILPSLWLDAADSSTITENEGKVSQWNDKSGNGNHAVQGTSAYQPSTGVNSLNGLNVVEFDLDYMALSVSNIKASVFVTTQLSGSVSNTDITSAAILGGLNNNYTFVKVNTTDEDYDISIDGSSSANSGKANVNGGTLVAGGNISLEQTNAENESDNIWYTEYNNSWISNYLGAIVGTSNKLVGSIAEIVLLSSIPSTSYRQKLEGYLAHKWGLTAKLPESHPYKYDGRLFGYGKLWSPYEITTSLWLDANDESTITHDTGSVSQWNDKSGNGNHAVQGTGTKQPTLTADSINGLPIIKADNVDDAMIGSFAYDCADEFHVFMVASKIENADSIFDFYGGTTLSRIVNDNSFLGRGIGGSLTTAPTTSYINTNPSLIYANYINSNVATNNEFDLYINGNQTSQLGYPDSIATSAFTTQQFETYYILDDSTGGNAWDGGLGEYIIIRGSLSNANRQKIEGYLAHKWGLTANLPAEHPWKDSAPTV